MKVIRWSLMSLLVTGAMGLGVGCEDATSPTTTTAATASALSMPKASSFESKVSQKTLATDQSVTTGPGLVNAWGLAFDPKTHGIWISVNGTGSAQLFSEDGQFMTSADFTGAAVGAPDPTGVVFNDTKGFDGDELIFASESGIIVGLQNGGSTVNARFPAQDAAVYKGLAVATVHGEPRLFAADFHGAKIDILAGDYSPIDVTGSVLQDPIPHAGFAPFNILAVGHFLIVSFAKQDDPAKAHDDVRGPGNGFIDVFDGDGTFITRLLSGDDHPEISSPWAMQLSAERDEKGSVDLLIGNFGGPKDGFTPNLDGLINVYELSLHGKRPSARFEGHLADGTGAALNLDGLWGFIFGNGRNGFGRDDIYFAAGPLDESAGLFGELDFISARR